MAPAPAFVALVAAVAALLAALPASAQLVQSAPPAGFEDLDRPQPAVVDLWYDGARLGTANALLAPGEITFDDPAAVAALLPAGADVAAVAAALRGPLPTHAARRCGPGAPPDCGLLEPEVAGVIVDAATFRVDVFVAAAFREAPSAAPRFLPAPGWSPSAVQGFAVTASAVPDAESRAVLSADTVLASGPARVAARYGVELDDGPFLDELAASGEHRRWRGVVGLGRTGLVPLLGERRFVGARLATTLDTRLDRDAVRAPPVVVTLARRGQVEVLRDGRLLSVQTLPAGTSRLDTIGLPAGAYDVTLRIATAGDVREERRFIVKSDALPPAGEPAITIDAGVFAAEASSVRPELGDTPFVRGGLRYRLGAAFAAGPDLALTPREAVASLRGLAVWRGLEGTADVFVGSDAAAGVGVRARGQLGRFGYAFGARRIVGEPSPGTVDTRDADDVETGRFVPGRELERITAFAEDSTELDLALSYQSGFGPRLALRGFWRDRDGRGETYSIGPNLVWPVWRHDGLRLDLFAEAAATDSENFVFARLRLGFDGGPWRTRVEGGWRGTDGDGRAGATAAAYASRTLLDRGDERLRAAARLEREPDLTSLGAELDYDGRPGRLQLTATRDVGPDETRFAAQARTTLAAGLGGVGLLGRGGRDAALVARVDPADDAARAAVFEVVVDGRPRRRLRAGARAAIPLAAYEAYRVRLRQVDGPLVDYDGRTRRVNLYPGTVATARWTVRPLVTVFARLVDATGRPLADARLDTEPPSFTDARGYFQADLGAGAPALTARVAGVSCRLALPDLAPTTVYHRLGDVPCAPSSPSP